MSSKMAAVGWQGIIVQAPADWSLVGISGDEKKGYFRVDSPVSSALEVRWSAAYGRRPDLEARAMEFLAGLEKNCKKKRIKFTSKLKPDRCGGTEDSINFNWRADQLGQGRLLYCRECDRVIIAQIISTGDENVSHVAPIMLGSISDHRDDGWTDWALYGLHFAVPAGYKVEKHSLMSGYLSLSFKKRGNRVVVERWGLASTLLAEDELEQWYRKDVVPGIKGYRFEIEKARIHGHEGLTIHGHRSGLKQLARAAVSSLTLHRFPDLVTGYAWHCADSNRLFSIQSTHSEGDDNAELIRDIIKCHEAKGSK